MARTRGFRACPRRRGTDPPRGPGSSVPRRRRSPGHPRRAGCPPPPPRWPRATTSQGRVRPADVPRTHASLVAPGATPPPGDRRPPGTLRAMVAAAREALGLPLFPTSLVGSFAQPDWLIDRARLADQFPPRVRATELWRPAPEHLLEAQDDATLLAIRAQERAGL